MEVNNVVYDENSSSSDSISESLIVPRPPSEICIETEIALSWNETESIDNSAVANDEVLSDTVQKTECGINNSKNSSETRVEFETVSKVQSEIQNTHNVPSMHSEYIDHESLIKRHLV